jgi:hypothetical protein
MLSVWREPQDWLERGFPTTSVHGWPYTLRQNLPCNLLALPAKVWPTVRHEIRTKLGPCDTDKPNKWCTITKHVRWRNENVWENLWRVISFECFSLFGDTDWSSSSSSSSLALQLTESWSPLKSPKFFSVHNCRPPTPYSWHSRILSNFLPQMWLWSRSFPLSYRCYIHYSSLSCLFLSVISSGTKSSYVKFVRHSLTSNPGTVTLYLWLMTCQTLLTESELWSMVY